MRLAATDWSQVPDAAWISAARIIRMWRRCARSRATERKWEAHREYVDVQILLSGQERLDWAILPVAEPVEAYPERTCIFTGAVSCAAVSVRYPAHLPSYIRRIQYRRLVSSGTPQEVRKAVLKWYIGNKKVK